jgi:hypothetical protein
MKLHQFCHLADEKMALDAAEIDHLHVLITRHGVAPPCTGGALTKSPFMHLAWSGAVDITGRRRCLCRLAIGDRAGPDPWQPWAVA